MLHGRVVAGRRVRVLAGHVARLLPPRARVLDLGCGDGKLAAAIAVLRGDVAVIGADVLRRRKCSVPLVQFDGRSVPFPDSAFDAVLLVDVLHHTYAKAALLAEAVRVSADAVIVKDHLADGLVARPTLRAMDWVGNARFGVALPYSYLARREWHSLFDEAGLVVDHWSPRLGIYPPPLSLLFDRSLHFVARLRRAGPR